MRFAFILLCFSLGASAVLGGTEIDASRVKEIAALLPPQPTGIGPRVTDRPAWEALGRDADFSEVVARAEELAKGPVPALPDELYLDYSRTGNRDRCQRVLSARSSRIDTLTVAECLENKGRFLAPLVDAVGAACSERTWVYPAHDGKLDNFYGRRVDMDLRATAVGWELATAAYLLGDKLPQATRDLIRANVERRVLQPFRDMVEGRRPEIFWMRATHNWNAVCLSGVTGAALALEDSSQERAWFIAAAEKYIQFFLSGFTPDGYCSEGIGYWNYGYGHFLLMSEAIRRATAGKVDLLGEPDALQPALFSLRTEILNGIYPTIADCHPGSKPDSRFVQFICERLGLETPAAFKVDFVKPAGGLVATALFASLPQPLPQVSERERLADSKLRTWFKDGGVLICRTRPDDPAQFGAALKGGDNAEHHNHNDVGSFSVVSGQAMVICDPGGEVYTARTFSAHRYDSKVLNSYGHAVPVVAGRLQRTGKEAKAVVRRTEFSDAQDTLALDLRSAYPEEDLKRLERTFTFRRNGPVSLRVRDEVAFSAPERFEEALITWGSCRKISETELEIRDGKDGVRVAIDAGGRPFTFRDEVIDEDVENHRKPHRLGIAFNEPIETGVVILSITPLDRSR